jgi:hypothetical protein
MISSVRYAQTVQRLEEQRIIFAELSAGPGLRLVVTGLGGRIFAFAGNDSLFWLNPAFADAAAFEAFVAQRDWNIGGDRVWIGPEIQFITRGWAERPGEAPFETPAQMDPGDFALTSLGAVDGRPGGGGWLLQQQVDLAAHTAVEGRASIRLKREIAPARDPLARGETATSVFLGGYEQRIEMAVDGARAQWWSVTNLPPPGEVYFASTPGVRSIDFIQPAPAGMRLTGSGYVGGRITGDCAYKLGFPAPHLLGRYAYLWKREDGAGMLFVRSFTSPADGDYGEEVAHQPGYTGAMGFIYNDNGDLGAFGEAECMGAATGGSGRPGVSRDRLTMWIYSGTRAQLAPVMRDLLGVEI